MSKEKALSIRDRTLIDSLERAMRQTPAEKIKSSLKLSNLCFKLFDAVKRVSARKK